MNILIESGATKSTCIGFSGTCTFFMYKTTGINATYASNETIKVIFEEIIAKNNIVVDEVKDIRYYGAGCFIQEQAQKVKKVLSNLFPNTNITVFSDLYAACHALCKRKKGFVGILGTGAASCFYEGEQIVNEAPSLGWLLGDEGSGTYLGKLFVIKYLSNKIKSEIVQDFENTFTVSKPIVFEKVYRTPNPQTFFASIPVFLQKHLQHKQIKTMVENSFQEFFNRQIEYYPEFSYPWFFCGSIAFCFQDILFEVAQKNNLKVERIIQECAQDLLF
jgi:N-acetylglucosamine kinase-like BadF-type ATPase